MTQTQANEQDQRLAMLNTLLTTPHRDLTKVHPVHADMIKQDPLFYGHLAAWYFQTGEIRDHKEMFVINLCLSDFPDHRQAGLAMLREMPPYQIVRIVDFIHGKTTRVKAQAARKAHGRVGQKDYRPARAATAERVEKFGLYKNVPRSVTTEISRYLKEREADKSWFDSSALIARKYMKRLYALLHITPSERAQAILFDGKPPEDSSLAAVKDLRKATSAAEQAEVIIKHKIPYRIASTVVSAMTPTVMLALIQVMSDQELINNMGSLRKRGVFNNPELKELIEKRLEKAKTGKKVSALKAVEAAKASGVSSDLQEKLANVADTQIKSRGRIVKSTALLVDASGSMQQAIELGKQMATMISTVMDAPFYCYAFDSIPYPIKSKSNDLKSWEEAFRGIKAGGATCCGAPVVWMTKHKQVVEQIVIITDEGETTAPAFLKSLQEYSKALGVEIPYVFVLRAGDRTNWGKMTGIMQRAGVSVDAYEFTGDYYSLPQLIPYLTQASRLELLMEIMGVPLPERKAA